VFLTLNENLLLAGIFQSSFVLQTTVFHQIKMQDDSTKQETPIIIGNTNEELEKLAILLKDCNAEWNLRTEGLFHFQKVIKGVDSAELARMIKDKKLDVALSCQMEDRRSNLCKEACRTVSVLALQLQQHFESLSSTFVPTLFKLLIITIKVIAESAHNCFISFLPYANSSIPIIVQGITDAHPVLRSKAAEYLLLMLQKNKKEDMQVHVEMIEASIIKGVQDSSQGTRANARQSFVAFNKQWPERVQGLLSHFEPSIQKMLAEGRNSPTKSPKKSDDFRKFLAEKKTSPNPRKVSEISSKIPEEEGASGKKNDELE